MGTPPDWDSITIGGLLGSLLDFKSLLDSLKAGTDLLLDTHEKIRLDTQSKLDQLAALGAAVGSASDSLAQNIDQSGLFFLVIPPSEGGTSGFVSTLSATLSDADDPDRPQFGATAFAGGIVLLVGGASTGDVQTVLDKLTTFLGADPISLPSVTSLISPL